MSSMLWVRGGSSPLNLVSGQDFEWARSSSRLILQVSFKLSKRKFKNMKRNLLRKTSKKKKKKGSGQEKGSGRELTRNISFFLLDLIVWSLDWNWVDWAKVSALPAMEMAIFSGWTLIVCAQAHKVLYLHTFPYYFHIPILAVFSCYYHDIVYLQHCHYPIAKTPTNLV